MKDKFVFIIVFLTFLLFPRKVSAATSDLGCELITDTQTYQTPNLPKPGYLKSYIDPVFGSRITRITGDPGTPIVYNDGTTSGTWPDKCKHYYSTVESFNADQSIIWLQSWPCTLMLDGTTYKPLKLHMPPITPKSLEGSAGEYARWHPTNPDLTFYTYINEIGWWNVRTGQKTVIDTFPQYTNKRLTFGGKGDLSNNGKMVVLYVEKDKHAFAYDLESHYKYPTLDLSSIVGNNSGARISASGKYIFVTIDYGADGKKYDNAIVYDLNGNQIGSRWSSYGCPSHYDMAIDENGDDVAAGQCKSNTGTYINEGIVKRRLVDGKITTVGKRAWSAHTSTNNVYRPFYAYSSPSNTSPYYNEILSIKLDGSRVERLARLPHNTNSGYTSEMQASSSFDGRKILAASN